MPGVPPDALAQVKKGLRGLFNRKKRSQADTQSASTAPHEQQQPSIDTKTTPQNPTITTTAPSPSPGETSDGRHEGKKLMEDGFPPPPPGKPPGNNGIDPPPQPATHISSPSGIEEARDIDLDPSSSSPARPTHTDPTAATSAPPPTTGTDAKSPDVKSPTETFHTASSTAAAPTLDSATKPPMDHNGMSATSGPLDDSAMMYGEGRGSADVDGRQFLEQERDLEDDRPKGEVSEAKVEAAKATAA